MGRHLRRHLERDPKRRFRTRPARRWLCLAAAATLCAGCASLSERADDDPYEGFNRGVHALNKALDRSALRPLATAYDAATPGLLRLLIGNALDHLEAPRDFANHLLAGRWQAAGRTVARFGLNSLIGAGGLLDPAADFGLEKEPADFGQTLARHGVGEGFYYEIPVLGPTTLRHTVGRVVDLAFAPTTYVFAPVIGVATTVEQTARVVELRARNAGAFDNVLYGSPDSYALTRTLYLQSRRGAVAPPAADGATFGVDDLEILED